MAALRKALEEADPNGSGGPAGYAALHHAALHGHLEVWGMDRWIEWFSIVDLGGCPFSHILHSKLSISLTLSLSPPPPSPQVAEVLLQYGANPEQRARHGWRPLHLAALRGQRRVALLLLNRGVDASAEDLDGEWGGS